MTLNLIFFSIWLLIFIYLVNSAIAGKLKKINIKIAVAYAATIALMGVFGEVFVGHIYNYLFHHHLWDYTVFPVHEGFTSEYAPVIWGSYGFHLYLFHDTLREKFQIQLEKHLALIFSLETAILEMVTNGSFKLFFGQYLFYYWPNDLWHLTSIQTIPFYLIAGFALTRAVSEYLKGPKFHTVINGYLTYIFVFLIK